MPKQHPFILLILLCQLPVFSQTPGNSIVKPQQVMQMNGLKGSRNAFIKNIGQYGDTMAGHVKMGTIKYGYEGNDMLVLFTAKGLMHLHRKIKRPTKHEEEELERKGVPEEEIEQRVTVTEKVITMEWEGTNPDAQIIAEEETFDYHTYGQLQDKAYGYRKITYKNLYPGIDVIYHFTNTDKTGFEYSLVLQPAANLSLVRMKYGGDTKRIKIDKAGNLVINSGINGVIETRVAAFSSTDAVVKLSVDKENPQQLYNVSYQLQNKLVSFSVPGYDETKTLIIDPFVSNTNTLNNGGNGAKAIDIDFDYAGNIYVSGGGSSNACRLAKYDPSGTLLWTFNGTVNVPNWLWFGYGGWVVEKSSGNIFMGQGATLIGGTRIIRLSSTGVYDNFITNPNPSFLENWKMLWNCNNGNPQILVAGGGNNSNINLGVCSPPSITVSGVNITGIIPTFYQDIADIVIDPLTNDMYTIFASPPNTPIPINSTPGINNNIFKHSSPYSASTIAWRVPSGYNSLYELANRPYLSPGSGFSSNSLNALAINSSFLYYWDGLYLKAFNKADGSTAGTPLTVTGNTVMMQGGIIADECNNVFTGNINGTIKVYKFDGVSFNDAAAPDISIPGFPSASVYDLVYDDARKLLYTSGDGFVASFDIASYCTTGAVFNLTVNPDCPTLSVQANVSPAPPVGTTLTYALFVGTTQIATNTTGFFSGLIPGTNYTVKAFLNQACSGVQLIKDFTLNCGPVISATFINPSCNLSNGSINASAISGTAPYQFSIDGINFQTSGIFTGLSAGSYSIIVKDAVNDRDTIDIILANSLPLQVTAFPFLPTCPQNNGIIVAVGSGGAAPLKYSIDGITFGASGIFPGLAPGNYTVTVKDTNNCIAATSLFLDGCHPVISATFINPSCNISNGSINASAISGTPPYQFSKDGTNFQASGIFTGLAAGNYSIIVKDAVNFRDTIDLILVNSLPLQVTATTVAATCAQNDGIITATGSGGAAPLRYSIDGITFGASGIFAGLASGNYTITVKDTNDCIAAIPLFLDGCHPVISATFINPSCNISNGSINASAISGTAPYQFSKDGTNFQAGGIFIGLAAGNYSIIVKDAANFRDTIDIILVNSLPLLVTASTVASSCTQNIGAITATGSGGAVPLKYSINGTTFQSSGIFTGLAPGNYTLTVKDTNACVAAIPVFLDGCIPVISATFINPSCNIANGSIDAAVVSGRPPFQFTKNGINFQTGNIFTGLTAGNYSIIVKDANNLRDTVDILLVNSLPLQLTASSVASSCTQNNGIINAGANGGAAPLKYSIDGNTFQPSGVFTGLAPRNYIVTVKDTNACIVVIPVLVDTLNTVFANAGNNFTICEGTTQKLTASSNGNAFLWTPATGLSNPVILNPDASPVITTMYTLTATTGICIKVSSVNVFVKPAPVPNAGRDTGICSGKNAQLNGSGGASYSWTPATYLSAPNIANPLVLQPKDGSISYRLSVTGFNGCPPLEDDTVTVTVSSPAKLFVGNDTSIAINQPLRLQGTDVNNTGFNNYTWSPAYGLNNPFAKDPTAIINRDVLYSVIASNAYGCSATDDIKVKVYEGPEIYVPNAFTPGGDALNDVLKAIAIGMKEFHYFSVFNRYAQIVFTTANAANGWDGNFKGTKQPVGTYVWMAEAVDYRGNLIQRKGTVILIR